ncbi:MAG TPA: ABC-type transport auxiliary lipoprotein family protein [Thiopseudomonas sp.]|nr:ABC-type transport auxiliary lipoprotein family protein [Thiopseudomonas sp.]
MSFCAFIHRAGLTSSRALLAGAALLVLAGCASKTVQPSSYMLPASTPEQQYSSALAVAIAPIRLTGLLDNEGIVMELNDIEVYQARQHLWAEDIGIQLQQQLQQRLTLSLPQAQIVAKGQPLQAGLAQREVRVSVNGFQGSYNGNAIVQGQWLLLGESGQLLQQKNFKIEQPLPADGYPTLVRTLAAAWDQVSEQLAAALAQETLGRQ